MAGKTKRKRNTSDRLNTLTVVAFLILLVSAATIYFRSYTGILGEWMGGAYFRLFGALTPAVPVLVLCFLLAAFAGRLRGKLLKTLLYLLAIFLCVSMILGARDLPEGMFSTTLALGAERGLSMRGAGWVGALFTFLFRRFIGEIGILMLTVLVIFFFILHLFNIHLVEFFAIVGGWISGGWDLTRRKLAESREKKGARQAKRAENTAFAENGQRKVRENKANSSGMQAGKPAERDLPSALSKERTPQAEPADIRIYNYAENAPVAATTPVDQRESKPATQDTEKVSKPAMQNAAAAKTPFESEFSQGKAMPDKGNQLSVETLGLEVPEYDIENTYLTPPLELLKSESNKKALDTQGLQNRAKIIENTLESFGIEAHVVSIQRGPTVTQFELKPQAGVKVSRITNLSDDLALALAAQDIRIEAPIPGKPYVGVEVPNAEADAVWLRDILQSDAFVHAKNGLPIALGQSIEGTPVVAPIAKMPHLLIAGATGSGKSVCINTIIMSILYKYSPAEVRLVLVDPKVVELSVYNDIPHLLIPVVTDPKKATRALFTLVKEMERRFRLFSQYSVRDIDGYREQRKIDTEMENLPYIVLIIDELSDLMMVASKDVESHITRLAQMARACGIHLIIATQRPSVDVITGTIKANIPSRISFQVSSSIDSRTILDQSGAEKLLGKGDMLYYPATFPKPKRVQGAFVTDREVQQVVQFLTEKHDVRYDTRLIESLEQTTSDAQPSDNEETRDALMEEVLEFIRHEETTSISGLQRRFRIGYARAGRIIDELESMGVISPQDGAKPRQVYLQEDAGGEA